MIVELSHALFVAILIDERTRCIVQTLTIYYIQNFVNLPDLFNLALLITLKNLFAAQGHHLAVV